MIECEVDDAIKEFVVAAVKHVNATEGKEYQLSQIMSCDDVEGGKKIVLCMVVLFVCVCVCCRS